MKPGDELILTHALDYGGRRARRVSPFVLEGVIAGALGAALSWGLLYLTVPRVTRDLAREVELLPFIGLDQVTAIAPIMAAAGIGIAAVSSILALRRFLQV